MLRTAIVAAVLLVVACSPTVPPTPHPVVQHRPPPADWFHQQLAAAAQAKRNHQLARDIAGAEKAHDDIVEEACIRLALTGSDKYATRCNAVLQHAVSPSQFVVPNCDNPDVDSAMMLQCND